MADARRSRFDVVMVCAFDRMARSVKHFLDVMEDLNRLNIEFISFRENIDTGGPLGRAVVVIVGAIAELERNLIVERVRAGMRRAKLEGRHIGRRPLDVDRAAILRDRQKGLSLTEIGKAHGISRALDPVRSLAPDLIRGDLLMAGNTRPFTIPAADPHIEECLYPTGHRNRSDMATFFE
jgi:DNA invertase Pin-like site-specific DNA recombinase